MNSFNEYANLHSNEIIKIRKKLSEHVDSGNMAASKIYGGDILEYRAYLGECLANFNKLLDIATDEYLPEKIGKMTDFDRTTKVESSVSPVRFWRDVCKSLIDTIDNRVSYIQSLLSFEKEYAKKIERVNI